jgi:hypothetical protein
MTRGKPERVRAGAERGDRHPALHRGREAAHRGVRPLAETQRHHDPVGAIERLGARHAGVVVGVDRPVRIEREQHRTAEAVALAEDLREHGQPLFAAVLLVAGEEHEVAAGAGARTGRVGDGSGGGAGAGGRERGEGEQQGGENAGWAHAALVRGDARRVNAATPDVADGARAPLNPPYPHVATSRRAAGLPR